MWAGLKVMVSSFALPEFFRDLREEKTDSAVCSQNKQSTLPHHKTSPAAARRRVGPSKCDQGRVPGLPLSAQMVPPKTWCPWAREGPIIINEAGVTAWSGASSVWALDGIMSINVPTAGIFTAITGQPDSHGPACTWLPCPRPNPGPLCMRPCWAAMLTSSLKEVGIWTKRRLGSECCVYKPRTPGNHQQ